jgi:L-alanine-DL-glutamate epimerase-like enolase superfamily enzyme
MQRRSFLQSLAAAGVGGALSLAGAPKARAALPKMKITRVRIYAPPDHSWSFANSNTVVTVETDAGITGIGEGGFPDTLKLRAGRLIGQDPQFIEHLWQDMSRAFFYPPGRELQHAIGALDLALWDIRGKVLKLPVHQLLGGAVREHIECYPTFADRPGLVPGVKEGMGIKEVAQLTIAAGYRAYRMDAASKGRGNAVYDTRERALQVEKDAAAARAGVGPNGDWCIDFHQRFDFSDAVRAANLIEPYAPLFVEDPVRAEMFNQDLPKFRAMTKVPIAAGEEWGARWDFNRLVEEHDIDHVRASLPNVGGITEMMKIAAICETHAVGMIPHFTGPIATAALVNCLATYSGPVLMECNYGAKPLPYLPVFIDFRNGKLWPNERPGLGVELDLKPLKLLLEVKEPTERGQYYTRPDGSITNW